MTNEHTLEKYISDTLFVMVGKVCVWEVETGQTATYWPQIPLSFAALLSHSSGCSTIWSKISRYNLDRRRVELGAIVTPTGNRCMSNDYITRCHGELSELESVAVEVRVAVRGSENQLPAEGWALRTPVE